MSLTGEVLPNIDFAGKLNIGSRQALGIVPASRVLRARSWRASPLSLPASARFIALQNSRSVMK
jgi:hypothetical protein